MTNTQLDIETAFIGTLIRYPSNLYRVDLLPSEMEHLGEYYTAIKDVFSETGKTDFTLIADKLSKINTEYGVSEAIEYLVNATHHARSNDASGLCEWLKNQYQVRRFVSLSEDVIKNSSKKGVKASDLYSMLDSGLKGMESRSIIQTQAEVIQEWIEQQQKISYVSTGFKHLDMAMNGGLFDGNVYGIAGYAKSGKTILAGTISSNLAESGVKHMYIAMEMGAGAIESRNIARKLGVENWVLRKSVKDGENPIKSTAMHNNTLYANCPGITWEDLKQQILIAIHKHGIKGFIVDYWQLLSNPDRRIDNHQYWATAAQEISDICKKTGAWCILVAQLNDDGKTLGSRGLVRACDMLWNIEPVKDSRDTRWLKMDATRYTAQHDIGSETNPYLWINPKGPHMSQSEYYQAGGR